MARGRFIVPVLVGGLLLGSQLRAQGTTGTIIGRVVDSASQQGIANVNIVIMGAQRGTLSRDDGGYTLTLLFAEPVMAQPGKRIFNVFAEGQPLLTNFDLVTTAGPKTAISRSFTVNVNDRSIDLSFVGVVENAIVSANWR